jgi:NAD(P)-dependent dehydrogenase (short-subunit alcohol dehydrogenase family)
MPEKPAFPPQHQDRQPGRTSEMRPKPKEEPDAAKPAGKLEGKVALVTGGDSGIGRAVAYAFAKEGADVAVVYLDEHRDAEATRTRVEEIGRRCVTIAGDVGDEAFCRAAVARCVAELGRLDVLVNNAAEQHEVESLDDVDAERLRRTFATNVFAQFFLAKAALPHLGRGSAIVNTASVTAYKGSPHLLPYSATKGAVVSFTRSLAGMLVEKGVRVNAVAPGPVWTPLIPASFAEDEVEDFGEDYPLGAAQPWQIAPAYVFLACEDASNFTGQVLHPNSGAIVNG